MIIDKNSHLLAEFKDYINSDAARDAYDLLIGAAADLNKFECFPVRYKNKNKRDFRYYNRGERTHPFSFITNKSWLLFYLRKQAFESGVYNYAGLKSLFPNVKKSPNYPEWIIYVRSKHDASSVIENILLKW